MKRTVESWFRDLSLRTKITVVASTVTALTIVATALALSVWEYRYTRSALETEVSSLAGVVAANSVGALEFEDAQVAGEILESLRVRKRIVVAGLYTQDGKILAGYRRSGSSLDPPPTPPGQTGFRDGALYVATPVTFEGRSLGTVLLVSDLGVLMERLGSFAGTALLMLAGAWVLSIFASSLTSRILTRPVLHLVKTAERVSEHQDYAVRATKETGDELGILVDAFNKMLRRIHVQDAELRSTNVKLEERVRERTRALEDEVNSRREAQRALKRRAVELERSNRDLDSFAYVASHDLKAPLRAIDNLATWLWDDYREVLPEDGRETLQLLRSRARRLESLLDDLLAYSRVGRRESEPERIDTTALAREAVEMVNPPDTFTVTVGQLPEVTAPRTALELLLRNLIGNAVKHHDRPDGRIEITGRDLPEAVEITVSDDGPGVPPEYRKKVFSMFQTLKPRDEVEGTGMGLAIVRKVTDHYGGSISLLPAPDRGARFVVRWPKSRESSGEHAPVPAVETAEKAGNGRVREPSA